MRGRLGCHPGIARDIALSLTVATNAPPAVNHNIVFGGSRSTSGNPRSIILSSLASNEAVTTRTIMERCLRSRSLLVLGDRNSRSYSPRSAAIASA